MQERIKQKKDNKIDIIIPAYKAQKTLLRTLSSIATQTILKDLSVTIVNDCCPNGDYKQYVDMFSPYMDIREIKLEKNGGPGIARQYGIDNTDHEFFTCIDADDTFAGAIALETLREGIKVSDVVKCCSATFLQLGENLQQIIPHTNDMVWMFGKLYRREFIKQYKIHFNNTRANEDTGFNTWVRLLCTHDQEQIRYIQEAVYYWHNKKDSITRINDGQYALDQCFCGWTDNMIYAIQNVQKVRPFSEPVSQWIVNVMMQLYYYYIETEARKQVFAKQNWEYVKKFYHTCYTKIKDQVTEEMLSMFFSMCSQEKWGSGSLVGIIPPIGIREFLDKLEGEEYDPDHIYDVWEEMQQDDNTKKLMQNNITCGVCGADYFKKRTNSLTEDESNNDPQKKFFGNTKKSKGRKSR